MPRLGKVFLAAMLCAVAWSASATDITITDNQSTLTLEVTDWFFDSDGNGGQGLLVVTVTDLPDTTDGQGPLSVSMNVDGVEYPAGDPPLEAPVNKALSISTVISGASACTTERGNTQWKNITIGNGAETNDVTVNHLTPRVYQVCCDGQNSQGQAVNQCAGAHVVGVEVDDDDDSDQNQGADTCNKPNNKAAVVNTWANEFGGAQSLDWPERETPENFISAPAGNGKAISFTTDDIDRSGVVGNLFFAGSAFFQRVSIAPCQADWSDDVPEDCRFQGNSSDLSIVWTTEDDPSSSACVLAKDTRYYLNLGWTDSCTRCIHRLQIINR